MMWEDCVHQLGTFRPYLVLSIFYNLSARAELKPPTRWGNIIRDDSDSFIKFNRNPPLGRKRHTDHDRGSSTVIVTLTPSLCMIIEQKEISRTSYIFLKIVFGNTRSRSPETNKPLSHGLQRTGLLCHGGRGVQLLGGPPSGVRLLGFPDGGVTITETIPFRYSINHRNGLPSA